MNRLYFVVFVLVTSIILIQPLPVKGLTVKTVSGDPSVKGEPVTLRLKISSRGVEQGPRFPLGPVQGQVGETINLGTLSDTTSGQVQLLVEVPWGSYFESVPSQDLRSGSIKLTVYPTDRDATLTVSRHGALVQPFPGRLMVREVLVVNNSGQGLVGGDDGRFRLDLPEDLERVIPGPSMEGPDDLRSSGDVYRYMKMFPPGETILGFFYMISPSGDSYTLERTLQHQTDQLVFSVPKTEALTVEASGLNRRETSRRRGGGESLIFSGRDFSSGDRVSLKFSGLSDLSTSGMMGGDGQTARGADTGDDPFDRPSTFSNISWPLWISIGFSLLIFVASYSYVQYRLSDLPEGSVDSDFLVKELAKLDQEFEDGAIDEPFYQRTRRRWKNYLKELEDDEST